MGFEVGEPPKELGNEYPAECARGAGFRGVVGDTYITVSGERAADHGEVAEVASVHTTEAIGELSVEQTLQEETPEDRRWARDQPRAIIQRLADAGFDMSVVFGGDPDTE